MRFEWNDEKEHQNLLKHGVRFETAALVFDDPYALTQHDDSASDDVRWITVGSASLDAVLFVVHTSFEREDEETTRIISARAAAA